MLQIVDEGTASTRRYTQRGSTKRFLAALVTMLALSACASPLAKAETPQQALDAAAQRAGQLKSAKFDLEGNVKMTFPPELAKMFQRHADSTAVSAFSKLYVDCSTSF